jgi:hypothetical protein
MLNQIESTVTSRACSDRDGMEPAQFQLSVGCHYQLKAGFFTAECNLLLFPADKRHGTGKNLLQVVLRTLHLACCNYAAYHFIDMTDILGRRDDVGRKQGENAQCNHKLDNGKAGSRIL